MGARLRVSGYKWDIAIRLRGKVVTKLGELMRGVNYPD
ncbi:hypothetical protein Pogu_2497 [Pyrobaculum oguniense TE7]|uniref:Uncharacterized protein n=1 Tax=Pyrobaculum oguniense (strain DSM 13380 / JCM 10595 / TE7) TaxID=698757 RepID=H6QDQ3_PYROT|nr:hypothetical protein Pogu_2497 [Pyrobaculum oguniense TE7]